MVAHAPSPTTWEVQAEGTLHVWGQSETCQKEHSTSEARVRPVSIKMMVMILFDQLWYYSTRDETQEKALTWSSLWLWSFPAVLMSHKPFLFPIWQPRELKLRRLRPSHHGDLLKDGADWRLERRLLSSHTHVHNSVFPKEGTVIWKIVSISPAANCSLHLNVHMESPEKWGLGLTLGITTGNDCVLGMRQSSQVATERLPKVQLRGGVLIKLTFNLQYLR